MSRYRFWSGLITGMLIMGMVWFVESRLRPVPDPMPAPRGTPVSIDFGDHEFPDGHRQPLPEGWTQQWFNGLPVYTIELAATRESHR